MNDIQIISSFEHSVSLELALTELEENGIEKENIVAVPLDPLKAPTKALDTIHRSDGKSLLDLAAILGTIFSVLGASYGFALDWGPIIWGLLGLAFGACIGFIIDYIFTNKQNNLNKQINTEVILIIKCPEQKSRMVKQILVDHLALGVGFLKC